jgi:hypothetical protein
MHAHAHMRVYACFSLQFYIGQKLDLKLWPFALDHAIFLWNNILNSDTRLAPIEVFTSTKFQNYKHLERCNVWGRPVFVLDPALQDGNTIPKWNQRSIVGMYLGNSPVHSSTVARVLNLRTGYITAQYHIVHDDLFSTVHNDGTALGLLTPEFWNGLLHTGLEYNLEEQVTILYCLFHYGGIMQRTANGDV